MKSVLLIGLGRFGRHIAEKLNELGELLKNCTYVTIKDEIGEARAAGAAKQAMQLAITLRESDMYKYGLAVSFGTGGQYSAVSTAPCPPG